MRLKVKRSVSKKICSRKNYFHIYFNVKTDHMHTQALCLSFTIIITIVIVVLLTYAILFLVVFKERLTET